MARNEWCRTLPRDWHGAIPMRDAVDVSDVDARTDELLRTATEAAKQGTPISVNRKLVQPGRIRSAAGRRFMPAPVWRQVVGGCAELVAAEVSEVMTRVYKRPKDIGGRRVAPPYLIARRLFAVCIGRAQINRFGWEWLPAWETKTQMTMDAHKGRAYLSDAPEYMDDVSVWTDMLVVEYGKCREVIR